MVKTFTYYHSDTIDDTKDLRRTAFSALSLANRDPSHEIDSVH